MQNNPDNIPPRTNTPGITPLLDRAAAALLLTVISVAVLFPETFITDFPVFGSQRTFPLSLLLPIIVVFTVIYGMKRRGCVLIGYVDLSVIFLFVYLLLRDVTADPTILTFKYALLGLGLFMLTATLSRRIDLASLIMWLFVGLACLTCLYAVVEYIGQQNYVFGDLFGTSVVQPAGEIHRAGSTLVHPVSFGAFLIQLVPFCLLAWYVGRDRQQRLLGLVVTALAVLALFLTYSKGSWIVAAMIAGGLLLYAAWQRSSRGIYIILVVVALIVLVTGIFWQQVSTSISERSEVSVNVRVKSWEAALDAFRENPVFGVGLKQGADSVWSHLDLETRMSLEDGNLQAPVDNYYLNVLLEEGVVGLVLWLAALVAIVVEGIRFALRPTASRPWVLAALVGIAGLAVNAVTFDALLIWPNYVIFWVTAGLLHGLALTDPRQAFRAGERTDPVESLAGGGGPL